MSVRHKKHSDLPDGADPSKVHPSDWNDEHVDENGNPLGEIFGFSWHWFFSPGLTIAAGDQWQSNDGDPPTIDSDPFAFYDDETSGAVTPAVGGAGSYLVEFTCGFRSATATGAVAMTATGSTGNRATPIFDESNVLVMRPSWLSIVDLGNGDNTIDLQSILNASDHDITLLRVDVRAIRIAVPSS